MNAVFPAKKIPPKQRTSIGNGRKLFVDQIDERSTMARRFREIFASLINGLGQIPSERQIQLARRAASLSIMAEAKEAQLAMGEPVNATEYATLSNSLRRVLEDLKGPLDKDDISALVPSLLAIRRKKAAKATPCPQPASNNADTPASTKADETLPTKPGAALGVIA